MSEAQSGPLRIDDLKRLVRNAGFQVYGTQGQQILLAERVRDNLILDSGISLSPDPLSIIVTVRAQMIHFPGQPIEHAREFADRLGDAFLALGYTRERSETVAIQNPNQVGSTLDTVCEVVFQKALPSPDPIPTEIQLALDLARTSSEA